MDSSDTPQFRGGNPYFFSENLINPYPSLMHRCIAILFARIVSGCSLPIKIAILRNKNRQQAAKTRCYLQTESRKREPKVDPVEIEALRHVALHRRTNLPFFRNLAGKASCVNDKTFVSLHILKNLFFSNLPQIRTCFSNNFLLIKFIFYLIPYKLQYIRYIYL